MSETISEIAGGVNIFDAFETDVDAEENGKWFEDILGDGSGLDIKVRHMTSQTAVKHLNKLMTANRKHFVKGKLPPEVDKRILIEHVANAILIDWRGVLAKDNTVFPYTPDNAVTILTKLPKFREAVMRLAQSMDAFKAETQEDIAGN